MCIDANHVVQVTNVAPTVTNDQLRTLMAFVGPIREIVVYPSNDPAQQMARVCYVKYMNSASVGVAQHLTNTVFIDRAIMVKPVAGGRIPDEILALKLANEGHSQNSSNSGVFSQIANVNGVQSITTTDPRLNALGLPNYPPLPASLDPSKIEEIRRTVSVSNISQNTSPEDVMEFFNQFGEIKYLRMTSNDTDIIKSALIEFTDQSSVANALQNTGTTLNGSQLIINHSSTSILKPSLNLTESSDSKRKRISKSPSSRRRSSRSPSRRRSRSSHRSSRRADRRSISRSRSPRDRSPRDRSRRHRSRSHERSRRRSVDRRRSSRSRSYSKERHRSSRERSSRHRSGRSRERDVRTRDRSSRERTRSSRSSRDRERDRDRSRRESSRDRHRSSKEKDHRGRKRERERSRESERIKSDRHRSRRSDRSKERSSRRSRSRSKTKSSSAANINLEKKSHTEKSVIDSNIPSSYLKDEPENSDTEQRLKPTLTDIIKQSYSPEPVNDHTPSPPPIFEENEMRLTKEEQSDSDD